MIIVVGGEKGGTGKTTIATNLATIHATHGKDVLLVDTDRQGSASDWAATRDSSPELLRIPTIQKFGKSLTTELQGLADKYEDIIVDAGGRDSIELRASMLAADRLYVPLIPSQIDVWTLSTVIKLVEESQLFNSKLTPNFVLSRAPTNPAITEIQEVTEALHEVESFTLCDAIIRDRIAYRKAPRNGMGVTELKSPEKDEKAILEIMALYEEVFRD